MVRQDNIDVGNPDERDAVYFGCVGDSVLVIVQTFIRMTQHCSLAEMAKIRAIALRESGIYCGFEVMRFLLKNAPFSGDELRKVFCELC